MPGELTRIKQALEDWLDEDPANRSHILTMPEAEEILRRADQKRRAADQYEHFT